MSQLDVIFWDVQHGNAAFVSTPNGKNIVIDLGVGSYDNSDETFSPLSYLRTRYGIQRLDAVLITHPHGDHIDDIFNFDSLSPKVLLRPRHLTEQDIRAANQTSDTAIVEKYLEISRRYNAGVSDAENPFEPSVNGGVVFQRFFPKNCGRSNLNNHSIVSILSYAGLKLLIPGDNEKPSWSELLLDPAFRQAIAGVDVSLAPHHGREAGFCVDLFNYFKPRLTIVSDGSICDTNARDRYRERSTGWKVFGNDGQGEVRYCLTTGSDGAVRVSIGPNSAGGKFLHIRIFH